MSFKKYQMLKFSLVLFIVILVSGCYREKEIIPTQKQNDTSGTSWQTPKIDTIKEIIDTNIFKGLYVVDDVTSVLQDCKDPSQKYWVVDGYKKLSGLYNKTLASPNVYATVVVEVRGRLSTTTNLKHIEKYPKTLYVQDVISVEKKNSKNTCVPYDFWALGNEPNWSLQISEKENLIELIIPGEKTYYFFFAEPKIENGVIHFNNHNKIQRYVIEIAIRKQKCSDTMSDKVYDYSVEVNLVGIKKLKGCGIRGSNFKEEW